MAGPATANNASLRELFGSDSGREFMERTVLTRKVYERLRDIAEGKPVPELPPLPAIEDKAETVEGDTQVEAAAPAAENEGTPPADEAAEAPISED